MYQITQYISNKKLIKLLFLYVSKSTSIADYRLSRQAAELTRRVPGDVRPDPEGCSNNANSNGNNPSRIWRKSGQLTHGPRYGHPTRPEIRLQILASGELLHKRIQAILAKAIITQQGKPKTAQWSPDQIKDGHHKRELFNAACGIQDRQVKVANETSLPTKTALIGSPRVCPQPGGKWPLKIALTVMPRTIS